MYWCNMFGLSDEFLADSSTPKEEYAQTETLNAESGLFKAFWRTVALLIKSSTSSCRVEP